MPDEIKVLALVRDLMFSSQIAAEARAAGVGCRIVRDPAKFSANSDPAKILLVDLTLADTILPAIAWKSATGGRVIGFASHVDTDTIRSAQLAGFDQVLPRSRFVQVLAELIRSVCLSSKESENGHPSHS
jgi:hypothetical protein